MRVLLFTVCLAAVAQTPIALWQLERKALEAELIGTQLEADLAFDDYLMAARSAPDGSYNNALKQTLSYLRLNRGTQKAEALIDREIEAALKPGTINVARAMVAIGSTFYLGVNSERRYRLVLDLNLAETSADPKLIRRIKQQFDKCRTTALSK